MLDDFHFGITIPLRKDDEGTRMSDTPRTDAFDYGKKQHATKAYAIRVPCGLYFGGFRDQRKDPVTPVKWVSGLCEARLFGGNCYAQAEKYVERIKAKDSLYLGMKIVTVELLP